MLILVKPEHVLMEMIELAVLRIAGVLRIHPRDVHVEIFPGGRPSFTVDSMVAAGLSAQEIQSVIQGVWEQHIKPELAQRLWQVRSRRDGSAKENFPLKEEKAPQKAPTEAGTGQEKAAGKEGAPKAGWWKRFKRWWRRRGKGKAE